MKLKEKIIEINSSEAIADIAFSKIENKIIYTISPQLSLVKFNIETSSIEQEWKIDEGNIDASASLKIYVSPKDKFICITNKKGQYGFVFDLGKGEIILKLDRKKYHTEQTVFPIQFLERNNDILLIHCTDWNHLEITNLSNNKLLTQRINKYETDTYLDYFYGELHLSPDGKSLLSSGWVWNPVSVFSIIDLDNWLDKNINEPELNTKFPVSILSYYWDRAFCWLDDKTFACLYAPKEEDLDEEECTEYGFEMNGNYILIYDLLEDKITKKIKFDHFPKNDYSEATEDCKLFYNGNIVCSSESKGVYVLEKETGDILYENSEIRFDKYESKVGVFYSLKNNKIAIYEIVNE